MKTLSPDTSVKAEKIQIELIRRASISKRLQAVNSLVKTTWKLSWLGIIERYPNETHDFLVGHFVHLLYGDESLAQKVKLHWARMYQAR